MGGKIFFFIFLALVITLFSINNSGVDYHDMFNVQNPDEISGIKADEKISPSDWISEDKIKVYDDKIVIEISNAEWARFTDTNSMDPVIDKDSNAIEIVPKSFNQINLGDIISYSLDGLNSTIIHRVIETGFDDKGWYAIAKGDNLEKNDPFKIRFNDIKRIVVAIIY